MAVVEAIPLDADGAVAVVERIPLNTVGLAWRTVVGLLPASVCPA
jgi:hypothetical protein